MKNEELKKLVDKMKEKALIPNNGVVNKMVLQHLSDTFYEKERDKQKRNKMIFSDQENNITR